MKTFYVLIDSSNGLHYGFTFDEEKAKAEAKRIEKEDKCQIDIYEFGDYSEF